MFKMLKHSAATVVGAAMALAPAIAPASESNAPISDPLRLAQAQDLGVSQHTMEDFVDAYLEVEAIRTEFADRLQGVDNEADAQNLREATQLEMVQAVEAQGISVEQYNEVATMMQQDPDLRDAVVAMIESRQ